MSGHLAVKLNNKVQMDPVLCYCRLENKNQQLCFSELSATNTYPVVVTTSVRYVAWGVCRCEQSRLATHPNPGHLMCCSLSQQRRNLHTKTYKDCNPDWGFQIRADVNAGVEFLNKLAVLFRQTVTPTFDPTET